jgi:hypothetical protein
MFEFKGVEAPQRLNRDFVLSKISDAMIMAYYHGEFKVGDVYSSKFRKDRKSSCGFYISSSGKLIYNDMSTREKLDCFAFVQKLYNCDFKTSVQRIAQDFGLVSGFKNETAEQVMQKMKNFDRKHKKRTKIHFKPGKWTDDNLAYWKQYHITKKELEREEIYPIKTLYINEQFIPNNNNNLRYALTTQYKGEMLTKVLSPDSDDNLKWVSSIPLEIPFGMDRLPFKSDFSFGAKAAKDRLVVMKFLTDVYASQNETKSAMSKKVVSSLFFNYDRNYLGWDPDETGLEGMAEMAEDGFIPCHVPVKTFEATNGQVKDWADVAKYKGLKGVEKLLKHYKLI